MGRHVVQVLCSQGFLECSLLEILLEELGMGREMGRHISCRKSDLALALALALDLDLDRDLALALALGVGALREGGRTQECPA